MTTFLADWLDEVIAPRCRPYTLRAYDLDCRHIAAHLGTIRLCDLTPRLIERMETAYLADHAPASVVRLHGCLHSALKTAVRWGYLSSNPADQVRPPRVPKPTIRTLSEEETARLIAATRDDRVFALWVLLLTTGLRWGEAAGLRWSAIAWEAGAISVETTLQYDGVRGFDTAQPPKSQAGVRRVPMAGLLREALVRHAAAQKAERLVAGPLWRGGDRDTGLIFCRPDGQPLYRHVAATWLARACARAGVPRVTLHELRHTAITHLLARGVYLVTTAQLAGHAKPSTTLDLYGHPRADVQAAAAQILDEIARGRKSG